MDEISKETLIGANIYDQQNKQGTITNPFGFFSITLPEGNTELNFSYIGYGSKQIALYLCKDTLLTVQLKTIIHWKKSLSFLIKWKQAFKVAVWEQTIYL